MKLRAPLAALLLLPLVALGKGDAPDHDDGYRQLELFARVLGYVENNYVEKVDRKELVYGAIKGMMDTLDPHSVFMPPDVFKEMKIDTSGEFGGLGLEIAKKDDAIVVVSPVDDTPAARAGIKPGDRLLKIDGESLAGKDAARVSQMMRGPAGKKVTLTIMRDGFREPQDITLIRDRVRIISVEGALYGDLAYLKVKNFQDRTDVYLEHELARLRAQNGNRPIAGVVLDLRNNPGGLLDQAVAVSDRFLPGDALIVSTRGRAGQNVTEERSHAAESELGFPMVVLVNGGSASASEIVAGALQDNHRATLIGTTTFGKGSVQTVIELGDGSGLKLTIAKYFTPSGRSIQERGIIPDFLVGEAPGEIKDDGEVREKDLQNHFKGDAAPVPQLKASLPPHLAPFAEAEALKDYQLKIALEYLHGLATQSARAEPGTRLASPRSP